jgi:hypothetical protein
MVLRLPHLVLEIVLGDGDILFTGVVSFLIIASCSSDAPGLPCLPPLATLGTFSTALDGGFEWCCSATAGGYFCVAQDEGNPNCLLT